MDRRMKATLRAALLAAVAAAGLLLTACSNVNIIDLLTTEVKRATNKFLIVQSVDPANGVVNANAGGRIAIKVDRTVDMATVDAATITLTDLTGTDPTVVELDYDFNDVSKILYLDPDPWLGDNTEYVLTITKGVKGSDGSELETEYTWSFTTGVFPKVNIKIEADKAATNKLDPTKLNLNIECNKITSIVYHLGSTEAECLASTAWYPVGGTNFIDSTHFGFAAGDGQRSVYIQLKDEGLMEYSAVRFDTIVLDTVKPTITVNAPPSTRTRLRPPRRRSRLPTTEAASIRRPGRWSGAGLTLLRNERADAHHHGSRQRGATRPSSP